MLISFGRVIRILLSFLLVRTLAKRAYRGGGQSHVNVCLGSHYESVREPRRRFLGTAGGLVKVTGKTNEVINAALSASI